MNVLYIHTHDSGRYLQPYGHAIPTPNLMTISQEGTTFRNAYCAGPTCSASRAALLSGMSPHSCGMLGLAHRGFSMKDYNQHLSHFLRSHGYHTALCGVQHEAPSADMLGYDTILGNGKSNLDTDLSNAKAAAEYIAQAKEPFFLSFGMFCTHRVYPDYRGHVDPDRVLLPPVLADTKENREDMASYIRSAMIADECVGIVMEALAASGKDSETLVLSTTDHGIAMPFMKCNLYDTGIGVSMMLKYPGNPAKGKVSDALVSHVDFFPTLCDLLGLDKPSWLEGVSFLPVLEGTREQVREEIFAEVSYHAAYEPMRCIRTRTHKLIQYYDWHQRHVPANIDASPGKDLLIEAGLLQCVRPREMLFDLRLDPMERTNLVHSPEHQEVREQLALRMHAWMEHTGDPLLAHRHRIPRPAGAKVNRLEVLEPQCEVYED